jgi:hypothetical protein
MTDQDDEDDGGIEIGGAPSDDEAEGQGEGDDEDE